MARPWLRRSLVGALLAMVFAPPGLFFISPRFALSLEDEAAEALAADPEQKQAVATRETGGAE